MQVAAASLLVYHNTAQQSEWVTGALGVFLTETAVRRKALERFRSNKDTILDYHRRIWPGVEWKQRQTQFGRGAEDTDQDQFFREHTVPTSIAVSYAFFLMNHRKRNSRERKVSCERFVQLCCKLFATIGSASFPFRRITEDAGDEEWVEVSVDSTMALLSGSDVFWTEAVLENHVAEVWASDMQSPAKTWIQRPVEACTLAEFITFALDPAHPKQLSDLLMPNALCLLSQIAYLLEEALPAMGTPLEDITISDRKRKDVSLSLHQKKLIVERVWSGQDQLLSQSVANVLGRTASASQLRGMSKAAHAGAVAWHHVSVRA